MIFEETVQLGGERGEEYLVATARGGVDRDGNIWLGQYRDMVKVFTDSGRFVRTVGRRGEGPGEFALPNHFIPLSDGGMLVGDATQGRMSRFSRHGDFVEAHPLPVGFAEIAPLSEGRFVLNMSRATPDGMGEPLHVVTRDSVLQSFGSPDTGIVDPRKMGRKIATDANGHIYSTRADEYRIQVWDASGQPLGEMRGQELDRPPAELATVEPGSRIAALSAGKERLVVLVHQLRRDWREHTVEATSGPDTRLLPQEQDLSNWFRARLDIFDVSTGELVASEHAPTLLASFIGTNVAVENRVDGIGQPIVVVWRIHTNLSQEGE